MSSYGISARIRRALDKPRTSNDIHSTMPDVAIAMVRGCIQTMVKKGILAKTGAKRPYLYHIVRPIKQRHEWNPKPRGAITLHTPGAKLAPNSKGGRIARGDTSLMPAKRAPERYSPVPEPTPIQRQSVADWLAAGGVIDRSPTPNRFKHLTP